MKTVEFFKEIDKLGLKIQKQGRKLAVTYGNNMLLATVDMDIEFRINTEYDALWCHFSSTKQKGVLDAVYHYSCTPLGDRE